MPFLGALLGEFFSNSPQSAPHAECLQGEPYLEKVNGVGRSQILALAHFLPGHPLVKIFRLTSRHCERLPLAGPQVLRQDTICPQ